jgi:hypothetical protein
VKQLVVVEKPETASNHFNGNWVDLKELFSKKELLGCLFVRCDQVATDYSFSCLLQFISVSLQ